MINDPIPNEMSHEEDDMNEGEALDQRDDNLAWYMDSGELKDLSQDIWKKTEKEEKTLDEFMKKVTFVLELCGLDLPSPNVNSNKSNASGDSYIKNSGTSGLYSSALSETFFNSSSNIMTTFFGREYICDIKTKGPLARNAGQVDPSVIEDIGYRCKRFYNAWFRDVLRSFKNDYAITIMWSMMFGSSYRKAYFDPIRGFPNSSSIPPNMILVNERFNKFYESEEITHKYYLKRSEVDKKIEDGEWCPDILDSGSGERDYERDTFAIVDRMQVMHGKSADQSQSDEDDEQILIYERHQDSLVDGDYIPTIITYGKNGGIGDIKINCDPNDPLKLPFRHFVKYQFLPSFDGVGYGLANYAGQNARAATVLERSTIDSTIAASSPPAFVKPQAKFQNHTINMSPGKVTTLATGDDDISKSITFAPISTPNPIMWQLKSDLEDCIKRVSHIVSEQMISLATQAPQGSVLNILGRMEQLPNAIMQGYYDMFCDELKIFKRMFFEFMPESNEPFTIDIDGELVSVMKGDFSPHVEVVPSGSFSSESTAYKMMRAEIILNQARQNPDLHNMRNVFINLYKDMGLELDIINYIMPDPAQQQQQVIPLDPLTENSNLLNSKGVKASLEQDHDAHILIHQQVMQSTQDPNVLAATHAHIQEHTAMKMLVQLQAMSGVQLPPDPSQLPVEQQNQIAIQVAQALMQQQQQQASQGPAQPIDPGLVGLEEVKAQKEIAHLNAEVKMKQIESESQNSESKMMLELSKLELAKEKEHREALKAEFELHIKEQELILAQRELELDHSHKEIEKLKSIVDMGREEEEKVKKIIDGD